MGGPEGLQRILSETAKAALPFEQTRRLETLEGRVGAIEQGIGEIKALLTAKQA
jgi:hypothetical protein